MGIDSNLAALLAYLLGIIGGLVFFLGEKENKFVRFHAMQSILLFAVWIVVWIVVTILSMLPYIGCLISIASIFLPLGYLAIAIILMIKAYQGEWFKLPIIGDMAMKQAG